MTVMDYYPQNKTATPMGFSPPGSSVHGISQAKTLDGGGPSPGDLPDVGIKPTAPTLVGRFFTTEPPGSTNL